MRKFIIAAIACVAFSVIAAPAAQADFGFEAFGTSVQRGGDFSREAGAHADLTTELRFSGSDSARNVRVDLPAGFVGNPTVTDRCTSAELVGSGGGKDAACPLTSQVGIAYIYGLQNDPTQVPDLKPVFNMVAPDDRPGLFAFNYSGVLVRFEPRPRSPDYAISTDVKDISTAQVTAGSIVTFWGVPADSSHDSERRGGPSPAPRRPFLTNPTSCPEEPSVFSARIDSWQSTGVFSTASVDADLDGTPYLWEGCNRLAFDPSVSVDPGSHAADSPTGLSFDLSVPQSQDPGGFATAHVRKVVTRLPEGMTVSASSANGLGACSSSEIELGTDDEPSCPASSKIGSVEIDTPLLDDPLQGDVILATQDDNPFHSLLALYIVVKGPGVLVKLPGRVDPDPVTGQLTVTFDNTPQLPFSNLHVQMRGGPTAALATPKDCGTYYTHTEVTSWASDTVVPLDSPMVIDEDCATGGFAPSFAAGTELPVAGGFSPFGVRITRPDGQQVVDGLTIDMPEGVLARLRGVPLCPDAQANAGTCAAGSRVGSATASAGPGATPFTLADQPVYLAGPYKGAPYSTSAVIRVLAGPFDLGTIVVRQALYVDPDDAHITIVSDPLPTILRGIQLRERMIDVDVDRPEFTINPTSCAAKRIGATFHSVAGATSSASVPFRAAGCAALPFKPKISLGLSGRKQRKTGGHPGLTVRLTQGAGQANLDKVAVALPKSIALDPANANGLCTYEEGLKADPKCPRSSIVGRATATTPLLNKPVSGPVYFVENKRRTRQGNVVRTLPTLLLALRGEVAINVRQNSSIKDGRLVSTSAGIPDAPVSKFTLRLKGGDGGILTVTRNIKRKFDVCNGSQIADVQAIGQNKRQVDFATDVKKPCGAQAAKKSKAAKKRAAAKRKAAARRR